MRRIAAIMFFVIITIAVVAQETDEELVRKNFESYSNALINGKGEEAVNYVDSHTLQYYNDIVEQARDADSLKVESLPLLDKIMVLMVRHRITKEDLLKFDGKALFIYAINNGMIDKSSAMQLKLGTVTIENDSAKGQIEAKGVEYPYYLNFQKENGQWKYDLTSTFALGLHAQQKYADEFGEKLLINMMLNADKEHKPSPTIWRAVR